MNLKKVYSLKMVIPAIVLYASFFIIPSVASLVFAFTDWSPMREHVKYIGFENFINIFQNPDIRRVLANTTVFAILSVIGRNIFGLILALALLPDSPLNKVFRTGFYLPVIFSGVVVGLIFSSILHPDGILNKGFEILGFGILQHEWLVDRSIIMTGPIMLEIWKSAGFTMFIYMAGLKSISVEYYEAATIDGGNKLSKFYYITLPLLMPSILINTVLAIIGGLQVFEQVYVLTQGGPGDASQVLNTIVFSYFGQGRWGMGSAANLVMMVFVLIISIGCLKLMNKKEYEL